MNPVVVNKCGTSERKKVYARETLTVLHGDVIEFIPGHHFFKYVSLPNDNTECNTQKRHRADDDAIGGSKEEVGRKKIHKESENKANNSSKALLAEANKGSLQRSEEAIRNFHAIELMIVDALVKANGYLQISAQIHDPSEYWKLDDSIIKTIETALIPELKESRDLILRIRRRNLYQYCNEYAVPKDMLEHFKDVTTKDIVCSQKSGPVTIKEEDVAVSIVRIDLTRGKDNPLESINFFKDYESNYKFPIPDDRVSHLLPASYQDMIVRVYSKTPELVGAISEAFENFQLKTYGVKTQVHETPEKKKQRRRYKV
ncbi:hypothetical protein ACFE04_028085 [Oxalis oulophora]